MLADMKTNTSIADRKRRRVGFFHRRIANPITRRLPMQTLLETTGRVSGQPRRTPVRIRGRWRAGTADLLPDDDPYVRLTALPRFNSSMVLALGTDLLTVRIDLDPV